MKIISYDNVCAPSEKCIVLSLEKKFMHSQVDFVYALFFQFIKVATTKQQQQKKMTKNHIFPCARFLTPIDTYVYIHALRMTRASNFLFLVWNKK